MNTAPAPRRLWRNARLATMSGPGWGLIEDGALLAEGERIAWVGRQADLPATLHVDEEYDLQGALLTPGLIDGHTHLVYGGHRADEAEQRLNGASYEAIARAGGGIRATVAATRAASEQSLLAQALRRARSLMRSGV
ncbi:MAG: imidazolonepropionase, partial [Sphingomonas sp.]